MPECLGSTPSEALKEGLLCLAGNPEAGKQLQYNDRKQKLGEALNYARKERRFWGKPCCHQKKSNGCQGHKKDQNDETQVFSPKGFPKSR